MNIRKITGYVFAGVLVWIMLSQCLIMRNRWSDQKALRVFKAKHIPLSIHDTVINGRHIHYAVSGSMSLPVLVFVHGSPGSWMNYMHYMWDTALQRKFRMVSIDRPGFGYSDFGRAMHLQQQCKLILPVLQSIKTTQPMYLCGHSLGGPAAVQLAASDTALFTGIVIASGALDIGLEKQETWRKIMNIRPFYWALPGALGPAIQSCCI